MPSILIATFPAHGHVTPLLTVAESLVAKGGRVRFLTGARFAGVVEATGAQYLPLPAEADFDDRQDMRELFPERTALKGVKSLAFDVENVFVRPARAQYEAVMAAHAAQRVDVVLADPALVGAALLLGHPIGAHPHVVVCGVVPLPIASRDTAPYGMGLTPLRGPVGRLRNAVLSAVVARTVFPGAQHLADQVHRQVHGTPLPFPVLDWPRHADAIVQFTVPEFEYPRSDAPAGLSFAGPISATGSRAALPPWWGDLDGSRTIVHVTQGTIANRDYRQVIAPTFEAFAGDDDILIVASTGGRPLDSLPPLPPNARAAPYLPYDQLLPLTDVYVTNGGYGGVQYALRYGVPIVTSSGQEDKPEVAGRVSWSGVGRRIRSETPTPAAVRKAVRAVLDDPKYRDRAQQVSRSMAQASGLTGLTRVVDQLATRRIP